MARWFSKIANARNEKVCELCKPLTLIASLLSFMVGSMRSSSGCGMILFLWFLINLW